MQNIMDKIAKLAESRQPWILLFATAFILEAVALYFQYGMGLEPCIMCIYQRTAVFGIMIAALVPILMNNTLGRGMGFIGWGVSAFWGLQIAVEHVDKQTALNPFFAACEIVPNFPAFMPLHEWIPSFFAATGDCGDIDWQFLTLSMPQWMIAIFAAYAAVFVLVLGIRLLKRHKF